MHNDLEENQPAIIINVENHRQFGDWIGRSVIVDKLLSIEETREFFAGNPDVDRIASEVYAIIRINDFEGGIRQRYLMPIPPLDDDSDIESKLILTPKAEPVA